MASDNQRPITSTALTMSRGGPAGPDGRIDLSERSHGGTNTAHDYFANGDPEDLSIDIIDLVKQTKEIMRASGIFRRARTNYNLFYARDGSASWEENLQEDGTDGGSMYVSVNVMKNALDHLIEMVTSHKPAIDPVTLNSSAAANDITSVAKALIDYRLHSLKDIRIIDEALRQTPVLGASFLHIEWNPFAGKRTSQPSQGGGSIPQQMPDGSEASPISFIGDVELECLSILDVFYDLSVTSWSKVDDCVVRTFKNRYDLMVHYPLKGAELAAAPSKDSMMYDEFLPTPTYTTTQLARTASQKAIIEVHTYYRRKSPSCPYGKMQIQLPTGDVLFSGPLPEWIRDLPIHRLCPDDMVGTAQGYAAATSSGGLQEALNIGASALLTNMAAFSRKLIVAQKGMDIDVTSITGDLKFLEVEFGPNGKPGIDALDLMGTPGPVLETIGWFVGQIEQNTGANSIVRGDPKGVTAGVAINLYQSMALQSASSYEGERSDAIAWFATTLVRAYQDHPDAEREVRVLGTNKTVFLKNFYGSQLDGIDSFVVDAGNPATRTLAMRYNMAVALKQDGVPIPPDKLVHLMRTGDWDNTLDGVDALDNVIRAENERMIMGIQVHSIPGDDPVKHAQGHLLVLSNALVREDPTKLQLVFAHLQEHLAQMSKGDIIVKLAAGMIPMGPFPGPTSPIAHGDTPAPTHPSQPATPKDAPKGPGGMPEGGTAPGRKLETLKPPPAPPAPPIPGVGGQQ